MRPVAELASSGLRGVFSDIDDTLTHGGVVDLEAYAALIRARAAGLRVVLVTGRPAGWAEVLASLWPVDAAIAENGGIAYLKRNGRLERMYFAAGEPADDAQRLAALTADILRTFPFARRSDDSGLRITDAAFDIGETQHLARAEVDAITTRIRELGARTLVSSVHAHACFHTADKALMSARVAAELWGESSAEVAEHYAFVGDSPNDQAAFAFFKASIGVANVARYAVDLRPPPSYVTPSPNGHGFAEAIEAILSQR
ncbi:MAG: haloacid dehalogenase-like hydrolase [Myxococcales bacterium]|nr:haloacid dehalogenase-like hydrolase [Myxococcales bacterium]